MSECCVYRFLSTIYLVRAATPKLPATTSTKAAFNLVIQRPRVAGGTLIIPLDCTVKVVKDFSSDAAHNLIRLEYGLKSKRLIMRASSPLQRGRWLNAILTVLQQLVELVPSSTATCNSTSTSKSRQAPQLANRTKNSQPSRSTQPLQAHSTSTSATNATAMQRDANLASTRSFSACGKTGISRSTPKTARHAPHSHHSQVAPTSSSYSLRRMLRQNIPDAIQFFTTVGQIVAAAT
ncbi:hypothetical protein ON010_g332 [Phytophthora cinnamomi]|nr:hypothetical protein ON010_g332 [Phytophthora cinnamomi]